MKTHTSQLITHHSLQPIVYFDALTISALVHAPPYVAASSNHDDIHILQIWNRRIRRKFQPASIRFAARAGRSQFVIDDFLIKPIVELRRRNVLLDPVDQLFLRIEPESEEWRRHRGIGEKQLCVPSRRA